MLHGCFKLLNETYNYRVFNYDIERIFTVLLGDYVLSEFNPKGGSAVKSEEKANILKLMKAKGKSKKVLYEIMKSMIYS